MHILVTGGTGYLGSAIVHALARRGHHAVVFARRASTSGLPGRAVDGDVRDAAAVVDAARGVDAVCHTAALVSVWRRPAAEFDAVNVGGLRSVLEARARLDIPRLVYTSSFLALPPAGGMSPLAANDYQRTKAAALEVAREATRNGEPIVSLFPGVVYGPGVSTEGNLVGRLVRDHLAGRLPGLIGADRVWSYAYVDDVADAHVAALTHPEPEHEYVIGGENAPQMHLFEILRAITGGSLPRRIPFPVAEVAAWIDEARTKVTGRPPLLTRGIVEIFRHDWPLDSARSIRDLGLRVRPLEEGLRALLAGMRARRA
ncbi:MAG TPA: NAD-dependent epimerase/dehydratase family protein [Vicinamibacterales bacterium]|nr:NAD-dependent epimerase/dehydratase family protein [Vicinamibacterales bacterium]